MGDAMAALPVIEAAMAPLRAEVERLTAALAWYADPANHDRGLHLAPQPTNAMADAGTRARQALGLHGERRPAP